jgi:DNA polymerase III subunit beta
VSLSPNEALFQTTRTTIYTRLVEGRFPPHRDVFPKKPSVKVSLPVAAFHAAVRQAAVMTDQESRKVVLGIAKGKLTLRAQGSDVGRSRVEMTLDYNGKPLEIAFNPQLLTDMLRALHGAETVELALTDGASPALVRCGGTYSYVIMPLT